MYAPSKFAVQAISDSMRVKLRPFGVSVSCLVVGKVDTEALGKILADRARIVGSAAPEILQLYSPLIEFFDNEVKGLPGIPPKEVGRAVAQALMKKSVDDKVIVRTPDGDTELCIVAIDYDAKVNHDE